MIFFLDLMYIIYVDFHKLVVFFPNNSQHFKGDLEVRKMVKWLRP